MPALRGHLEHGLALGELEFFVVDGDAHGSLTSQATREMDCFGQASTQAPQPMQRSTMM